MVVVEVTGPIIDGSPRPTFIHIRALEPTTAVAVWMYGRLRTPLTSHYANITSAVEYFVVQVPCSWRLERGHGGVYSEQWCVD